MTRWAVTPDAAEDFRAGSPEAVPGKTPKQINTHAIP